MSLRDSENPDAKTYYMCQVFNVRTINGRSDIVLLEAFHLNDIGAAIRKAERMNEAQHICGAIAYSIYVDEDAGDYGEMQNVQQFGSVPSFNLE